MSQLTLFDGVPSLEVEAECCDCCGDGPTERYPVSTRADCGHVLCVICDRPGGECVICLMAVFEGKGKAA